MAFNHSAHTEGIVSGCQWSTPLT